MNLSPGAYALIGLTALVAALVSVVVFAFLRFAAAARDTRRHLSSDGADSALLSVALQEAVTRLKAQERATAARAEASERLSGEIISSLTSGLLVTALNGKIRILNPAGRRMMGLPESPTDEACRSALSEMSLSDVIDECLASGVPVVRRQLTLPEPRHGVSHLGVTVSPLFDDQASLHGAICLFTDLTAVKDLEQQLRLKDSLAAVGELTAGIAHEFRNGLATIHGYSKLIDLKTLPEAYQPFVEGIRTEAESLGQVVTNFLNFARPAQLTLSRVDLRTVCERAADEIRADTRALGGDIVVTGEFGDLDGDDVLLRQAFSNLLRNALEACAGASVAPAIVIQSEIDHAQKVSRIAVTDNGPGIPSASRERVFQPFFTSKRNGTGLGLALVQKIIVFHNGRVVATSSPEGGASLQITLPLAS
ncbi:MAG: PAS domain-containing protein [Acidobacteria bacterium]|nr:PAS domain-containing protein [Acidobacteriota bacterium]